MSNHDKAWLNEKTGDIHSPKGRLVWPALLEAKTNRKVPNSKPKFNTVLLIPKGADVSAIVADIQAAAEAEHGKDWKKKKLRLPLAQTKDEPRLVEFAEAFPYVLKPSANADFKPFVLGPNAKPFQGDASDIYSGRWAIIAGRAWGYSTGSDGVGWNLNRVQLLDHDDPIANGRIDTSEGFEAIEVDGPTGQGAVAPGAQGVAGAPATADSLWG
jgi:hypothetical protein